jgi:hypothetical protein
LCACALILVQQPLPRIKCGEGIAFELKEGQGTT